MAIFPIILKIGLFINVYLFVYCKVVHRDQHSNFRSYSNNNKKNLVPFFYKVPVSVAKLFAVYRHVIQGMRQLSCIIICINMKNYLSAYF